jgi:hypothetical protein
MVGRPILEPEVAYMTAELKEVMCGDEAVAVSELLYLKYPVNSFSDLLLAFSAFLPTIG